MKNVMKKAHEITKKVIRKGDSYRATFKLALSLAHSLVKKGVKKMVELKGSEKQVKWATDIRTALVEKCNKYSFKFILGIVEKEESSKYFIDNFKYVTGKFHDDYEIYKKLVHVEAKLKNWENERKLMEV